jgi:hypothetical protein
VPTKKEYKIVIASSTELEELSSEIYFENELLATITREQGVKKAQIELWPQNDNKNWKLGLSSFIEACKDALNELDY